MSSRTARIREVIQEYIKPKSTLDTMNRIHNEFTGEPGGFSQWEDVEIAYVDREWSENDVQEFALIAKEIIESGVDELAESYFDIIDDDIGKEDIVAKLSNQEMTESSDSGFRFSENEDGTISGVYFYKTIDVDISSGGNIERLVNEKSVPFRITPENQLLIVETTYSPYVQKIGGVFNNQLEIPVQVCGDITILPDQAKERVSNFLDSFNREIPRSDWE